MTDFNQSLYVAIISGDPCTINHYLDLIINTDPLASFTIIKTLETISQVYRIYDQIYFYIYCIACRFREVALMKYCYQVCPRIATDPDCINYLNHFEQSAVVRPKSPIFISQFY